MIYLIGAGLNGLCTAYYLSRKKKYAQQVTVIERNTSYSLEASYINGCQNYYSRILPLTVFIRQSVKNNLLSYLETPSLLWTERKWFVKFLFSRFQ